MKYLAMRSMLGYVRTQKDRDLLRARFETALEKDPNDRVALRILSGVAESDRDPAKAAELLGRIIAADRKTDEGADGKDRAAHARLLEEADEHEVAPPPNTGCWRRRRRNSGRRRRRPSARR